MEKINVSEENGIVSAEKLNASEENGIGLEEKVSASEENYFWIEYFWEWIAENRIGNT